MYILRDLNHNCSSILLTSVQSIKSDEVNGEAEKSWEKPITAGFSFISVAICSFCASMHPLEIFVHINKALPCKKKKKDKQTLKLHISTINIRPGTLTTNNKISNNPDIAIL